MFVVLWGGGGGGGGPVSHRARGELTLGNLNPLVKATEVESLHGPSSTLGPSQLVCTVVFK